VLAVPGWIDDAVELARHVAETATESCPGVDIRVGFISGSTETVAEALVADPGEGHGRFENGPQSVVVPLLAGPHPELDQAIAAAQAATAAGYTIYAVAYGAASSGCSSGDTHNPCTTMQSIASEKTRVYTTSSSCQMTGSPNAVASLPSAFQAITTTLTKPRLVVK